jgi:hypothetical protein
MTLAAAVWAKANIITFIASGFTYPTSRTSHGSTDSPASSEFGFFGDGSFSEPGFSSGLGKPAFTSGTGQNSNPIGLASPPAPLSEPATLGAVDDGKAEAIVALTTTAAPAGSLPGTGVAPNLVSVDVPDSGGTVWLLAVACGAVIAFGRRSYRQQL